MKAFTDIEQSKKLAEILPLESADMHYVRKTHDFMGNPVDGEWSHPKYGKLSSVSNLVSFNTLLTDSVIICLSSLSVNLTLFFITTTHY